MPPSTSHTTIVRVSLHYVQAIKTIGLPPPVMTSATGPIASLEVCHDGTGLTAVDSEGGHDGALTSSRPTWYQRVLLTVACLLTVRMTHINVPHDEKLSLTGGHDLSNCPAGQHALILSGGPDKSHSCHGQSPEATGRIQLLFSASRIG